MIELEDKINKAFNDLTVEENEEKVALILVAKTDNQTLKNEVVFLLRGNKITATKIIRELLKTSKANELSYILEMVKEYL
jgi:hypothetical protein